MAYRSRTASALAGLLLLLGAVGSMFVQPDSARASSSIYNWEFYQRYRPNGASVVQVPLAPPAPPAPSQPPATSEPPAPPQPPAQPPAPPATGSADQQLMLALINRDRQRVGSGPIQLDPVLSDMAYQKASYMVANGYYNHYVPGYNYPYLAENL